MKKLEQISTKKLMEDILGLKLKPITQKVIKLLKNYSNKKICILKHRNMRIY